MPLLLMLPAFPPRMRVTSPSSTATSLRPRPPSPKGKPMLDTKTVQDYIRTIPDFPHAGILFRDVTTLFLDPRGFRLAVDQLLAPFVGQKIDLVSGLEAVA